ncbi:hypothetical protein SLEP1_g58582 [Rubroshorea leprosula]|uniref:Transposase n=1 Tax=Rubroshorea leprosula TaxID=152421 RepID=A0AAV5MTD1_9ROSI|nr:hypothetical protein SLEP1_g58582 [Rubroshorea leprosula]
MCPDLQIGNGGGDNSAQICKSVMVVVTIMLSRFPSSPISPSIFNFSRKRFKRAVNVIFGDGVRHPTATNSSGIRLQPTRPASDYSQLIRHPAATNSTIMVRVGILERKERVYKKDQRRNGTSTMNSHIECCLENPSNLKNNTLLKYVSKVDGSKTVIDLGTWKFDEGAVKRALAEMLIIDEDSFSLVEKLGFRRFCEVALPPTFKIPSRRTITRQCYDIYVEHRTALKYYFKESNFRVSLTTNTWTSLQRITYMSLTTHFINAKWKLHKKILCFYPVDSHKGDELGDLLVRCLKDWGLEKIDALTADNASANDGLVRVLKDAVNKWGTAILGGKDIHMRCAAHIVNLVVGEGTKEKEMNKSVTAIRAAVKYIRQSLMRLKRFKEACEWAEIESKKLLCLDVPTRWNSLYLMLDTAKKFEEAFERYARQDPHMKNDLNDGPNAPGFPSCIDWENVRRLIKFLHHFYELTGKVSGTLYTTSNLYLPELSEVDHILTKWERDVDLYELAGKMRTKYTKYWGDPREMNKNIFSVVVLDPRYKMDYLEYLMLKMYGRKSDGQLDDNGPLYVAMVKREMGILFEEYKRLSSSTVKSSDPQSFDEQGSSSISATNMQSGKKKTELEKYLAEDLEDENKNIDVLQWWKMNEHRFPVLATMARDVLAVPISIVTSELAFSTGGRVLDAFQSSLTPRMAQALICAQDWLRDKAVSNIEEEDLDTLDNLEKEFDKIHLDSTILE